MKINYLYIILLFTGLLACRKDKPIPSPVSNNTECFNFDWGNQTVAMTWFTNERFQYQTPYFNPNNSTEFVYNFKDFQLNEYKLMKYNLQTNIKTELANNVKIISQPKWSRKGWVAFDNVYNQNYQIWIVKDNGDSLTQFTNNTYNLYPTWDTSGINVLWAYSPVLGVPYYLIGQNIYASSIDTIMYANGVNEGTSFFNDISNDNIIISKVVINNKFHIGYTALNNIYFQSLINLDQENLIGLIGLTWSNNSQTAYFTVYNNTDNDGLFRLNIPTSSYIKIMNFCDTKRYKNISCSPDGKKLIGERVDSYLVRDSNGNPTGQIVENSSIYLIDLETMEETKINLE